MIEFYTPYPRQNHLDINANYKDIEREEFDKRFDAAKLHHTKNQIVVKSYILDNKITYGRAKA